MGQMSRGECLVTPWYLLLLLGDTQHASSLDSLPSVSETWHADVIPIVIQGHCRLGGSGDVRSCSSIFSGLPPPRQLRLILPDHGIAKSALSWSTDCVLSASSLLSSIYLGLLQHRHSNNTLHYQITSLYQSNPGLEKKFELYNSNYGHSRPQRTTVL